MLNGEERCNEAFKLYAQATFRLGRYEAPDQMKMLEDIFKKGVSLDWWDPVDQSQLNLISLILRPEQIIEYKGYTLDPISRYFTTPDSQPPVRLTRADITLLRPLMTLAPKCIPAQSLRDALQSANFRSSSLHENIKHLRRRVGHTEENPMIMYVPKRTYKFDPPLLAA